MNVEQMKLEQMSAESNYYKRFYDNSPVGFFTTARESGLLLKCNPAMMEILEISDIENISFSDFYANVAKRQEILQRLMKHNKVENVEVEIVVNGRKKWLSISATLCDNLCENINRCFLSCNGSRAIEGSARDITVQKRMEQQLQGFRQRELRNLLKLKTEIEQKLRDHE